MKISSVITELTRCKLKPIQASSMQALQNRIIYFGSEDCRRIYACNARAEQPSSVDSVYCIGSGQCHPAVINPRTSSKHYLNQIVCASTYAP